MALLLVVFAFSIYQADFVNGEICFNRCEWLPWGSWSSCSRTCGGGSRSRHRSPCCWLTLSFMECLADCGLQNEAWDYGSCNKICDNGGIYNDGCQCRSGFHGYCCTEDVNECEYSPCHHGMPCVNTFGSFYCICTNYWGGQICDIDYCKTKPAQLIFLVDASYSTTSAMFQKQLDFVADVIKPITISDDKFRVAVVTYSTKGYIDIALDSYENKTDLVAKVLDIQYKNGTTRIERGCDAVRTVVDVSADSAQYAFLLTDGMPTNLSKAVKAIDQLRGHLYTLPSLNGVILIAIGEDIRHEGLLALSGDSYSRDIYAPIPHQPLFNVFYGLVHPMCSACKQRDVTDVVFIVDISAQVALTTFYLQLEFLQKVAEGIRWYEQVNGYQLDKDHIQLGIVTFSETPEVFMWLNTTHDLDNFARMFNTLEQDGISTNSSSHLGMAVKFAREKFLFTGHGARNDARKFVIIVNTGHDSNSTLTLEETDAFKKQIGTYIISVGIGTKFKDEEIIAEASSAFYAYFMDKKISEKNVKLLLKDLKYMECSDRVNA